MSHTQPLPIIIGFGGINAAGRSSFHHAYRAMVLDALSEEHRVQTCASLAALMGVQAPTQDGDAQHLLNRLFIRRLEGDIFDYQQVAGNKKLPATYRLSIPVDELPHPLPAQWKIVSQDDHTAVVTTNSEHLLVSQMRHLKVSVAGQLPTGFHPGALYESHSHPRGLQMTIYGISDALRSMGMDWHTLQRHVPPDAISVYAGSAMGQLDQAAGGGMCAAPWQGERITSRHCPFSLPEMPADFINAYVLGSVGMTGAGLGACASFLYNLRMGIADIRNRQARIAIIGGSEAPITPEVIEGYHAMGALASDEKLRQLDGKEPDYRRACRPFGENCGFTMGESAQFVILCDDELALEIGAHCYAAVPDVFVHADGYKRSISAPGVGNYLTLGKAVACAADIFGTEAVKHHSFVQAHGTGTPQNRVTESQLLNAVAQQFAIEKWPVIAVKNYLGHSLGVAAGDQINASLGVWQYGILPGITATHHIAADVHDKYLDILLRHRSIAPHSTAIAFINSKGFGGNNATAPLLAPHAVQRLLERRHGRTAMQRWHKKNESICQQSEDNDRAIIAGDLRPIYDKKSTALSGDDIQLQESLIHIQGYDRPISIKTANPYGTIQIYGD